MEIYCYMSFMSLLNTMYYVHDCSHIPVTCSTLLVFYVVLIHLYFDSISFVLGLFLKNKTKSYSKFSSK